MIAAVEMTYWKAIPKFLFWLVSISASGQTLSVEPGQILAGGSATLIWDTGGTDCFIIGYGKKVEGKGSAHVSPAFSVDYVMVSESAQGLRFTRAQLLVEGAKGDDGYPSLHEFDDGPQTNRSDLNYIDFQSLVWSVLQDRGYAVRGDYAPRRPYVTAYTNFVLRPDLIAQNEKIRARRLAVAVEISEPQRGMIAFAVHPKLEFQYRGEDEWRPDREHSQLAQAEATKILHTLSGAK